MAESRRQVSPLIFCDVCGDRLVRIKYTSGALEKIDQMAKRSSCPGCETEAVKRVMTPGFPARIPILADVLLDHVNYKTPIDKVMLRHYLDMYIERAIGLQGQTKELSKTNKIISLLRGYLTTSEIEEGVEMPHKQFILTPLELYRKNLCQI